MKPTCRLKIQPFWAFPISIKGVLQITFLSVLGFLFYCSCNNPNDPLDPPNPPDPPIVKGIFECTDSILANCPLVGQWTFINSGCVPVNDFEGAVTGGLVNHKNSIVFTSSGEIYFTYLDNSYPWNGGSNSSRFYDVVNCENINIRTQENELIDQIEIIELTENRLRLRNETWCGTEDCLFIRTPPPYQDDESLIALNEEICRLHKCQSCGNTNAGFECSISYSYVDLAGDLNYVSSEKYGDRIIVCTEEYLLCLNLNFEILWKDSIDFDLTGHTFDFNYRNTNNFAVDEQGSIYIFYYTDNPQPNISFDIPHLRKFDIDGNLKFDKEYNYEDFKRDKGFATENVDHEIRYHKDKLYFVHSGLFAKFDIEGNLLTLKETNGYYRKKLYVTNDYIYIGFGDQTSFPKETIDFDLVNISPVNYQYSPILRTDNFLASSNRVFTLGNNLLIVGDYTRQAENTVWGYHVPGIVVQDNEVTDIVRSLNFKYDCNWGLVPISDTSIVSYVCDDYFELITEVNGKFRPAFRYKNEINSSDYYKDFKFYTAYQLDNKIYLLGTGKRFTETVLAVIVDLDNLYPKISCE